MLAELEERSDPIHQRVIQIRTSTCAETEVAVAAGAIELSLSALMVARMGHRAMDRRPKRRDVVVSNCIA